MTNELLKNAMIALIDQVCTTEDVNVPSNFVSTSNVCKMLKINRITLWRYGKDAMKKSPCYLVPAIKVKGHNLYRLSDVLRVKALIGCI